MAKDARRRTGTAPSPSTSSEPKRRKSAPSVFPWWAWLIVGIALIASLGRVFQGAEPARKVGKRAKGAGVKVSTADFLSLSLKLAELTDLSGQLSAAGALDDEAVSTISAELDEIEAQLGSDSGVARDMLAMVSIVRGTLLRTTGLTDEEIESQAKSFTYSNPRYWDEYYKKTGEEERFDWYGDWDTSIAPVSVTPPSDPSNSIEASSLGELLRPFLVADANILMLGCGNSDLSLQMYRNGFENLTNIDISHTLIQSLRNRLQKEMPRAQWLYMNASAMEFESSSFDVIVDKGTLDAIEGNRPLLDMAVLGSHKILRPGGLFLSVTFNSGELRVDDQLALAAWQCESYPFEKAPSMSKETQRSLFMHACVRK